MKTNKQTKQADKWSHNPVSTLSSFRGACRSESMWWGFMKYIFPTSYNVMISFLNSIASHAKCPLSIFSYFL